MQLNLAVLLAESSSAQTLYLRCLGQKQPAIIFFTNSFINFTQITRTTWMMDKIMRPLIHYKGNTFKDNKKLLITAVIDTWAQFRRALKITADSQSTRTLRLIRPTSCCSANVLLYPISTQIKNNSTHNYVKYIKMSFSSTNKSLYTCFSVLQT